jgi:hypothetical protein
LQASTSAALAVLVALGGTACERRGANGRSPVEQLDATLRPSAMVASLRQLSGAHYTGSSLFRVSAVTGKPTSDEASPDAITTTTELWLDSKGQYRLVENNDQDGGRAVVRYGNHLAVLLRHGKMIRRPAQEPEPSRLLEEAVGGPWAAWETVRRFAVVTSAGQGVLRVTRSIAAVPVPASLGETTPLRRWRDTVQVTSLEAEARLEPRTGALLAFDLKARFTATREDRVALDGEIAVSTRLDGIGATATITAPTGAEELQPRQRTILEERALLGAKEAR